MVHECYQPSAAAFARLAKRGAHFVLLDAHKKPDRLAWQRVRPTLPEVQRHGGFVAVIPASLACVVVDVDTGHDGRDAGAIRSVIEAEFGGRSVAMVRTGSGGWHVWFRVARTARVPNRKWSAHGLAGDIRGSNGSAILWDAVAVANAIERREALD